MCERIGRALRLHLLNDFDGLRFADLLERFRRVWRFLLTNRLSELRKIERRTIKNLLNTYVFGRRLGRLDDRIALGKFSKR